MIGWIDGIIVLLVLTNLKLLGSSRINACIRVVAVQGIMLGVLPLLANHGHITLRLVMEAVASATIKGAVFPTLLLRAVRQADVRREVEPFVGYTTSMLVGLVVLAASAWIGHQLPLPVPPPSMWISPAALFTIMVGLLIIVSRRTAVMQVLGYLVMENGIYTFGMAFAQAEPLVVELGILLDAFVAVFVMGITIFHISREFDHIDTDRLSVLKD